MLSPVSRQFYSVTKLRSRDSTTPAASLRQLKHWDVGRVRLEAVPAPHPVPGDYLIRYQRVAAATMLCYMALSRGRLDDAGADVLWIRTLRSQRPSLILAILGAPRGDV